MQAGKELRSKLNINKKEFHLIIKITHAETISKPGKETRKNMIEKRFPIFCILG